MSLRTVGSAVCRCDVSLRRKCIAVTGGGRAVAIQTCPERALRPHSSVGGGRVALHVLLESVDVCPADAITLETELGCGAWALSVWVE